MNKNKRKLKLNKEEGSGLVLALMVLLVLSVLGASLGVVTIGSLQLSTVNRDSNSAYYIAEAGVNMAYEELEGIVKEAYKVAYKDTDEDITEQDRKDLFFQKIQVNRNTINDGKPYKGFDPQMGEEPTATISIGFSEESEDKKEYTIQSVGKIGEKKRTVEKKVWVTWEAQNSVGDSFGFPNRATLIVKRYLELEKKGTKIIGDVYTNKKEYGNASYNQYKNYIDGTVIEDHIEFENVSKNVEEYIGKLNLMDRSKLPWFKLNSKENLAEEMYYQAGKLEFKEKKGEIYIGSNHVIIFADQLIVDESMLDVTGTGSLTFVVRGVIEFKDETVFNESEKNVRIVSLGNKKVEIDESTVNSQFIAPYAKIEIDEGKVYGSMFANEVVIKDKGLLTYKSFDFNDLDAGTGESGPVGEGLTSSGPTLESDE